MFKKIVSNLPFSPALVGQLGFYARRLKKEEATRRLGLIFTALALVMQSFAVFSPPEAANASSTADFVSGGVTSMSQYLSYYDANHNNIKSLFNSLGITRTELQAAGGNLITIGESSRYNWSRTSLYSYSQGQRSYTFTKETGTKVTFYYRPMALTQTGGDWHPVYQGYSKKIGWFAIKKDCGNLITQSPPPPPPQPVASCTYLFVDQKTRTTFRLGAKASAAYGAVIKSYTFTVKNSGGSTIFSKTVASSSTAVGIDYTRETAGTYKAQVIVGTSVGNVTSANCIKSFTVAPPPSQPSISIDKKVDGVEHKQVGVNTQFTYQIAVKNTGSVAISNAVVSDTQPVGVTFVSASAGTITSGVWKYTIPSLAPGETKSFTITAKVPTYKAGIINNTACVDAAAVTGAPDDCDDATIEVLEPAQPTAVCKSVDAEIMNRTLVTLKGSAETLNGATVESYTFIVKNAAGNVVKSVTVPSHQLSVVADSFMLNTPGKYTVQLTVKTSLGDRTDQEDCVKQFTIVEPEKCPVNPSLLANDPECQPCPGDSSIWIRDERCAAVIIEKKTAINMGANKDATTMVAKASDKISYTLTVENKGLEAKTVSIEEKLTDVLEYATLFDKGGGTLDDKTKTLSWQDITLKPGEKQSRTFVVQLRSPIPATNTGTSDEASYDCVMTNTFGNSLDIRVDCPAEKVIVEQVVSELPTTGPRENMIFAGALLMIVTYFYARARQMNTEVRLLRRGVNTGTI